MPLSRQQIAEYHERGYVAVPDVFAPAEVALLDAELARTPA